MNGYRRTRSVVKWGAVVVCFVLAIAWALSGWWGITRIDKRGDLWVLRAGKVTIWHRTPAVPRAKAKVTILRAPHPGWAWYPDWLSEKGNWMLGIPLWPVFTLIAVPTAMVFRRDIAAARRARAALCPACGYDLRGLGRGAVCPECGRRPGGRGRAADERVPTDGGNGVKDAPPGDQPPGA